MIPETRQNNSITKVVFALYVAILIVSLIIILATLPVGLYTVFFTQLSNNVTYAHPIHQLYFYIGLVPIFVPFQSNVGGVFVAYYAFYSILIALAAFQARNVASAMREGISRGFANLLSNPLTGTVILLGSLLFSTFLIDLFQTSVGVQVGGLSGDPLELFLSIVLAPAAEEIGFRLALIGIPIFIIGLLTVGPSRAIRALWRPSIVWDANTDQGVRRLSPGRETFVKMFAYLLLVLSSAVFGIAHYTSGAGWGFGKISEAGVAGMILGYAYIRYGFHTNIIVHWSVNNLTAYAFFSQGVWKMPWDSNPGSNLSLATEGFMVFALGAPSLALVGYRLIMGILHARKPPIVETPTFETPIQGPPVGSPQGETKSETRQRAERNDNISLI